MPELFELLQAEPSAASRHKREVVGRTLSSALDEQTCCSSELPPLSSRRLSFQVLEQLDLPPQRLSGAPQAFVEASSELEYLRGDA